MVLSISKQQRRFVVIPAGWHAATCAYWQTRTLHTYFPNRVEFSGRRRRDVMRTSYTHRHTHSPSRTTCSCWRECDNISIEVALLGSHSYVESDWTLVWPSLNKPYTQLCLADRIDCAMVSSVRDGTLDRCVCLFVPDPNRNAHMRVRTSIFIILPARAHSFVGDDQYSCRAVMLCWLCVRACLHADERRLLVYGCVNESWRTTINQTCLC